MKYGCGSAARLLLSVVLGAAGAKGQSRAMGGDSLPPPPAPSPASCRRKRSTLKWWSLSPTPHRLVMAPASGFA